MKVFWLLAATARAWVFYPGQVDIPNRFAWSQPADFSDDTGLGGGITYALDPALCSTILPQFKEEAAESMLSFSNFGVTFVDCTEITDAFMRAFAMWASNHRVLHFVDVSAACTAEGLGANCTKTEVYSTTCPRCCGCATGARGTTGRRSRRGREYVR